VQKGYFVAPPRGPVGLASEVMAGMDLAAAARALGVHYQTAYRWVRSGALPAVKVGSGYRLTPEDVASFAEGRRCEQAVSYTGRKRDWAGLRGQLYEAAVTGDETRAGRTFERLHLARVPILEQCEELVAPVARRLHDAFESGTVLAAQVRLAAAICERQLRWATTQVRERSLHRALVVGAPWEQHHLPMLMASAVLRADRWDVCEIDGSVKFSDLLAFAARIRPELIVISTTVTQDAARCLAAELGRQTPVPVLVGGAEASLEDLADGASIARETLADREGRRTYRRLDPAPA
jgi:excisionase family DNA binding protein